MKHQMFFKIAFICMIGFILAACTSDPEPVQVCLPVNGTCTPAPKKATSRPYEIKGIWYYPQQHYEYEEVGIASYYGGGDVFHGRPTATGKIFDKNGITAAHKTVPLPCIAVVTNLQNGREIVVEVNDRGPFIPGRIIDVSRRVAQLLGFEQKGTTQVRVRTLVPESLALNGLAPVPVMLAEAPFPPPLPEPDLVPLAEPMMVSPPPPILAAAPASFAAVINSFDPASAAPPAPSQKPLSRTPTRGIFVDVGSYASHEEAAALASQITTLAGSTAQPVQHKGPTPYAVRVGPLASMSTANQVLDQLIEAGHRTSRIIILR